MTPAQKTAHKEALKDVGAVLFGISIGFLVVASVIAVGVFFGPLWIWALLVFWFFGVGLSAVYSATYRRALVEAEYPRRDR